MEFTLWELGILSFVGVIAGWLNVMAGGGSLLTIPIMIFMGIPGAVANGTNRIAILAQNISATLSFFKQGFSELKLGLSLSLAAIPGAIIGALTGVKLDGPIFEKILAVVMIIMMFLMMPNQKSSTRLASVSPSQKRLLWGHICMFGVGLWGGFIQVGVGFIIMPVLNRVMGLDLVRVNVLKVFIVLCYTLVALAIFASNVKILWIAGLALALGNAIGGWLGAHWTVKSGDKLIRWVLNCVLTLFILKLLFF